MAGYDELKGTPTSGYGECSVKFRFDRPRPEALLCVQGKTLVAICFESIKQMAELEELLKKGFSVIPPRYSKKWSKK